MRTKTTTTTIILMGFDTIEINLVLIRIERRKTGGKGFFLRAIILFNNQELISMYQLECNRE